MTSDAENSLTDRRARSSIAKLLPSSEAVNLISAARSAPRSMFILAARLLVHVPQFQLHNARLGTGFYASRALT